MNARNQSILDAAYRCFARYGVGKTTMADIATEAGVARQTIYNAYPNKDELLRAVVQSGNLKAEKMVLEAWENATDFEEKLDLFFEMVPLKWFDAIKASPDSAELIDGIHRIASAEMDEVAARWRGHFETMIKAHFVGASDAAALADFIYSTAANAKSGAENRAEVEQRLNILKQGLIALMAQKA